MRTQKIYEVIMNLSPVEMFSNINQVIMSKLNMEYKGKCKGNALILEITGIIKRSMVKISKSSLEGNGNVNIMFSANVIIYEKNDILPLCNIVSISKDNSIICKYDDHAVVELRGNASHSKLKENQKIPVITIKAKYTLSRQNIVIYGFPYIPQFRFLIYKFSSNPKEMSMEEMKIYEKKLQDLEEAKANFESTDSRIRKFLCDVYYPYNHKSVEVESKLPKCIKKINFSELININPNHLIFRHKTLNKAEAVAMFAESDKLDEINSNSMSLSFSPVKDIEIIEEKPITIFLNLINECIQYLNLIKDLATEFNNEEKLSAQEEIFDIYRNLKANLK